MDRKLFSFDLDGTLLNTNSELSPKNFKALQEAKKKGHILVAATGRNYIYSQLVLKQYWDLFDYYIGCNGAIIHKISEKKIMTEGKRISYEFVVEILNKIKHLGGTIQVSTEWDVFTDIYLDNVNTQVVRPIVKERLFDPFPSVYEMKEKDKNSIMQISVHLEEHSVRDVWKEWNEKYGGKYELTITSLNNIDINIHNISKLNSLKKVIHDANIKFENVFVFGDSQNDVKALEYFQNTYAMENALQDAKDVAKHVIGNNDSDAIANIVKENI